MRKVLTSIEVEYRRYKALAEAAMAQLAEADLGKAGPGDGNSIVVIVRHVAGNLASRFTDFLTSDGEKPWRDRDGEFTPQTPTRRELMDQWERGWKILFESLSGLTDEHLDETITIRGTEHRVCEALQRSLAHTSYHVGQIVYLAKGWRGPEWEYLSVPPGGTKAYNENPTNENASAHLSKLTTLADKQSEGG